MQSMPRPLVVAGLVVLLGASAVQADRDARPTLHQRALTAMRGVEEIVFAERGLYEDGHYYATFGHWSSDPAKMMHSPDGSRLCKLNLRTRKLTVLLDDAGGGIRDPRVHYDGRRILFAYRKGGTKYYHLHEINTDGTGLRPLTAGDFDDVDPEYLADGGIMFVSSRCNRFVPCYHTQVGLLHRMDGDGRNVRLLSGNNVGDHRPAMLPDGRVIYTRWEYVDRAPQKFHSLWAMNPDGTEQMVLFGNTVSPDKRFFVMIDALPVPGSEKVVCVFSPGHGYRENAGHVMLVDPKGGPDDWSRAEQISPTRQLGSEGWARGEVGFRDPYPLSADLFLVAENRSLLVLDAHGATEEIFRGQMMVHDPRVIVGRGRERIIPPRSDPRKSTGTLILANIYQGRHMQGVKPGEVKRLLVLEDLPKPVSYYSLPGAISMDGTHTLHRILGTVPVAADGSAALEVPALRGLYFVALDERGLAVKRMQSYVALMPGETLSCVGCHEPRTQTTAALAPPAALGRRPSRIEPIADMPDVLDYPRDIQPILDRHCVECHNAKRPEGHVVLTGDRNEWFSLSYYALFASRQVSDSWRYDEDGNHPPRGFGSAASPLVDKIDGRHYQVRLTDHERRLVQLWIDTGATYAGTYAAFNREEVAVAGALSNNRKVAIGKPLAPILERRCYTCHGTAASLGQRHEKGRVNLPKHCWNLYNLSHPEQSMILLAPLATEAGGYGWCRTSHASDAPAARVFGSRNDRDYQAILQAICAAQARQQQAGRFDLPGFRPNEHYVRWMQRFGVLASDFDPAHDPVDVYRLDQSYWRSLWYCPTSLPAGSLGLAAGKSQ
jgi:hypothetical protein